MRSLYFVSALLILSLNTAFALEKNLSPLEQKASLGDIKAQLDLGLSYFQSGERENPTQAYYWLSKAANVASSKRTN